MITINSNTSALMAQNNLYTNQANLQANMEQLSTGLRINSASDDAAGLQISNRMQTQMNGLEVAQRNANDAISMAQTAEGAMTENTNIMNRMRDLALQSANDTNTLEDRQAMQKEVDALISEVDRISDTTNFAGIKLLDGTAEEMSFQIGSNANETIEFGISSMRSTALTGDIDATSWDNMGLQFSEGRDEQDEPNGVYTLTEDAKFEIHDEKGVAVAKADLTKDMTIDQVVNELNGAFSSQGVTFEAEGEGTSTTITGFSLDSKFNTKADEQFTIQNTTGDNGVEVSGNTVESKVKLSDIDITTTEGAQTAVLVLDQTLAKVDEERANLGAVQNRLESTISNLSNIEENLGVSQSRILDADFAKQTVEMTSNQMLMQAGTSVLAQAKTMPQYATMLL